MPDRKDDTFTYLCFIFLWSFSYRISINKKNVPLAPRNDINKAQHFKHAINFNVIYYYVLYITPRYTLHYRNCLSYNYIAVYHYVTMRRYEPVDIP